MYSDLLSGPGDGHSQNRLLLFEKRQGDALLPQRLSDEDVEAPLGVDLRQTQLVAGIRRRNDAVVQQFRVPRRRRRLLRLFGHQAADGVILQSGLQHGTFLHQRDPPLVAVAFGDGDEDLGAGGEHRRPHRVHRRIHQRRSGSLLQQDEGGGGGGGQVRLRVLEQIRSDVADGTLVLFAARRRRRRWWEFRIHRYIHHHGRIVHWLDAVVFLERWLLEFSDPFSAIICYKIHFNLIHFDSIRILHFLLRMISLLVAEPNSGL